MKLNQKMFMKSFLNTNTYFILVNINRNFLIELKVIGKMENEHRGIPINDFVRLKLNSIPLGN